MQVHSKHLIEDSHCEQTVRELRWPDGIKCHVSPHRSSSAASRTRNPPVNALRVPTVPHVLMIERTPFLLDLTNLSRWEVLSK